MRVAVDVSAIPSAPAGAGIYVLRLVEALASINGIELELVARRDDGDRWGVLAPGAEVRDVAPRRRSTRLVWEQLAGPALARSADVWHGPHYTMPMLAWTPRVVTIHDLTFFDHPEWHEPAKVSYFTRMIRGSVRRADALVCVSQRTSDRLHELLAPRQPVVVAPHGIDHGRFHPAGDGDEALLAALGVRAPFVAFVGTIEPRKNVAGLVRAAARLDPSVQLVLAGQDGWGTEEVATAIVDAGMGERVRRLGYVPDDVVPALYRRAAAVAYPAFEEGFGLPVVEALACGAAVVTTDGSVMADLAGVAALLVPPGDDDALAAALEATIAGGAVVDRRRSAGPAIAAGYTWSHSAGAHVEAYRIATA